MSRALGCPFCGATPHHGLGKVQHCQLHGEAFQDFSIWCPKGHAKITARDENLALEMWNRRPAEIALTEALKGCLHFDDGFIRSGIIGDELVKWRAQARHVLQKGASHA